MDKKKVLYIESNTDGTVGGSHFCLLYLVQGLDKTKYSPIVAFYEENRLISRFQKVGCEVMLLRKTPAINIMKKGWEQKNVLIRAIVHMPLLIIQKVINYFATFILPIFSCINILRKKNIDIVHLNNTLLRPQQWIAASLFTKAKIVAHERGLNNHFPSQSRFWAGYLSGIVCISGAVESNLIKHRFDKKKLFQIYDGLDPDAFKVTAPVESIRSELKIPGGAPVVGIVGNIKWWKGQKTVVLSMKRVAKKFPEIKCLLIGGVSPRDEKYVEELKETIVKNNLENCIIFAGLRKDVPNVINTLDILIHASVEPEPFGMVSLEGMALRKPVIATNIGAPPEIIEEGRTGRLVPPFDNESLSKAIIDLLRNEATRREMGDAGRERLEKHFHVNENIRKVEEMYNSILAA